MSSMADADLDYAIALSLAESNSNSQTTAVPVSNPSTSSSRGQSYPGSRNNDKKPSSKEDEDFALALSLSLNDNALPTPAPVPNSSSSAPPLHTWTPPPQASSKYIPRAMASSNDDEDLALALTLSLNEANNSATSNIGRPAASGAKSTATDTNHNGQTSLPPKPPDNRGFSNMLSSLLSNPVEHLLPSNGCGVCKKQIFGSYLTLSGISYHAECLVCAGCQNRIQGQVRLQDDAFYHPHCADELFCQRCCLCSNKLQETFYRNTFFEDEIYCKEHTNAKTCFTCHRKEPSASSRRDSFAELPDGRSICMECVTTAVLDSSEASPIYHEVLDFFEFSLNLPIPEEMRKVPILAVDLPSLNENLSSAGPRNNHVGGLVRGMTLSTVGHVKYITPGGLIWDAYSSQFRSGGSSTYKIDQIREVTAVLVLYGMPRDLTASVLAHEAMHVWIRLKKDMPFHLPPKVEEGLCQVVAHKFLEHISSGGNLRGVVSRSEKKLREYFSYAIESDSDPVYGDGFREAKVSVDTLSLEVVLDYVRSNQDIPHV
jgi:hypothetical protein